MRTARTVFSSSLHRGYDDFKILHFRFAQAVSRRMLTPDIGLTCNDVFGQGDLETNIATFEGITGARAICERCSQSASTERR